MKRLEDARTPMNMHLIVEVVYPHFHFQILTSQVHICKRDQSLVLVILILQPTRQSHSHVCIPQLSTTTLFTPTSAFAFAGLKRTPLPPQSLRFREMAKRPSDKADVSPSFPKLPPIVTRDGGMNQSRSTDVRNSLPAGPRHLLPVAPSREIIPRESRSSRLPPSGPSADSNGNRRRNENSFSSNQAPLPRDQNAMDLDVVQPFRPQPPTLKINELPIRAHSGMYADRVESNNTDTAPKQPRAMTNRMPSAHQPAAVPPTSPTSHFPQRSTAVPDYQGGRTRGRSPPPNMTRNHNEHPQDDRPSRFSQPDSQMLRRRMPPRRASNAEDRSPVEFRDPAASQGPVSRDQVRRLLYKSQPLLNISIGSRDEVCTIVEVTFPRGLHGLPLAFQDPTAYLSVIGRIKVQVPPLLKLYRLLRMVDGLNLLVATWSCSVIDWAIMHLPIKILLKHWYFPHSSI